MNIFQFVFLIPASPFILIVNLVVLANSIKESGGFESFLANLQLTSDEELEKEEKEFNEKHYYLYPLMCAIATFGWFLIFKHFVI